MSASPLNNDIIKTNFMKCQVNGCENEGFEYSFVYERKDAFFSYGGKRYDLRKIGIISRCFCETHLDYHANKNFGEMIYDLKEIIQINKEIIQIWR